MTEFPKVLIAGTGPASLQMAVLLKNRLACTVGIAGRRSARSAPFWAALKQSELQIRVGIQNDKHQAMQGECRLDSVYKGYETVNGQWDTLLLAVTADAYVEVLRMFDVAVLRRFRCVILLSPTFGSAVLVRSFLSDQGIEAEVISFSTYLGDTRWPQGIPSGEALTVGVKKKVYAGSTHVPSFRAERLRQLFKSADIALEVLPSALEAETRNISLFVHPPLFMNPFTLDAVFGKSTVPRYVYKLYPEGPITQDMIRRMLAAWKEISGIVGKLGIPGFNLLKFMIDDNYPVRPESLSRDEVEAFTDLEETRQEYLLYIRYASLLIDPFSAPDDQGRYYDFSAVLVRSVFVNEDGCVDIPRMPKEDYYRIKIIQGIARYTNVKCPVIDQFIALYECHLEEAALRLKDKPLSDAFAVQSFAEEINRICLDLKYRLHEHRGEHSPIL